MPIPKPENAKSRRLLWLKERPGMEEGEKGVTEKPVAYRIVAYPRH
jgi:hypothetical protein